MDERKPTNDSIETADDATMNDEDIVGQSDEDDEEFEDIDEDLDDDDEDASVEEGE